MRCSYKNSFNDFKIKIPFTFLSRHIYFLNACCRSSFEQIICAYVSLAFFQLKHHNWNFLVTHAQDISNLVHVHPTPASLHSSASIFECNAHISISNQQPMHWTKSLSYIFFCVTLGGALQYIKNVIVSTDLRSYYITCGQTNIILIMSFFNHLNLNLNWSWAAFGPMVIS